MLEIDQQPHQVVHVFDETDFRPHPVRVSRMLLDRNSYVISAAVMKTHELVISTLSLKNIIVGAAVKDKAGQRQTDYPRGRHPRDQLQPVCAGRAFAPRSGRDRRL